MHPRNTFVIQNNLIILPLKKKKSTVYSTYMLTIIFERERVVKKEKTQRKVLCLGIYGAGEEKVQVCNCLSKKFKTKNYQKVKREQEEKPCVRKIIDNNKGEN